jgi:hypothetical protein
LKTGYPSDLPKRFWLPEQPPQSVYASELSFHFSELDAVTGEDLVRFIGDCFRFPAQPESIWRWPLFCHDQSYPHYAWSRLGQSKETEFEHQYHKAPQSYCPLCRATSAKLEIPL